jgi:hypothetical protein
MNSFEMKLPSTKTIAVIIMALAACLAVLICLLIFTPDILFNRPGQTQARAEENAELFIKKAKLTAKRSSCAPDMDGDGYGSCTVVTADNENIQLQCPARFWTNLTGGVGCKEIDARLNINKRLAPLN